MNDKSLNIKIPENLHNDLTNMAKSKNISMASLVRIVLTEYIENEKRIIRSEEGLRDALMISSMMSKNKK